MEWIKETLLCVCIKRKRTLFTWINHILRHVSILLSMWSSSSSFIYLRNVMVYGGWLGFPLGSWTDLGSAPGQGQLQLLHTWSLLQAIKPEGFKPHIDVHSLPVRLQPMLVTGLVLQILAVIYLTNKDSFVLQCRTHPGSHSTSGLGIPSDRSGNPSVPHLPALLPSHSIWSPGSQVSLSTPLSLPWIFITHLSNTPGP